MQVLWFNPHFQARGEALLGAYKWMVRLDDHTPEEHVLCAHLIRDLAHHLKSLGVEWGAAENLASELVDFDNDESRFE